MNLVLVAILELCFKLHDRVAIKYERYVRMNERLDHMNVRFLLGRKLNGVYFSFTTLKLIVTYNDEQRYEAMVGLDSSGIPITAHTIQVQHFLMITKFLI